MTKDDGDGAAGAARAAAARVVKLEAERDGAWQATRRSLATETAQGDQSLNLLSNATRRFEAIAQTVAAARAETVAQRKLAARRETAATLRATATREAAAARKEEQALELRRQLSRGATSRSLPAR